MSTRVMRSPSLPWSRPLIPTRTARRSDRRAPTGSRALPSGDDDAGVPARRPSAARQPDRLDVEAAARDQPRDQRVRVPHLARAELVASPDGRRHLRHELEEPPCAVGIVAQAARALDRLGDVRDDTVAPASDLVAEDPEAGLLDALPTGPSGDDAHARQGRPADRRLLDHVPGLRHAHLERGVVEVAAIPPVSPAATASKTRPFRRTEWPPAPSGSQNRSMPAVGRAPVGSRSPRRIEASTFGQGGARMQQELAGRSRS